MIPIAKALFDENPMRGAAALRGPRAAHNPLHRGAILAALIGLATAGCQAPERSSAWRKHSINDRSPFEAAGAADFNGDGHLDIFSGDSWYQAPNWKRHKVRDIPPAKNPHYENDFADLPIDVNGDGRMDILTCAYFTGRIDWLENPEDPTGPWKTHAVDAPGRMETAVFVDISGDGLPDFLPNTLETMAWYELRPAGKGFTWKRRSLAKEGVAHGVGAGDIDGDGRVDVVTPKGWYRQPEDPASDDWPFQAEFELGSASILILVHDFDGDGKNDIAWGMGHDFGLHWAAQRLGADGKRTWVRESIDSTFSQVHTLLLEDLDGNGRPEIVTGKRIYAHETEPGATDAPCIYTFEYDPTTKKWKKTILYEGEPAIGAPADAKSRQALDDFPRGSAGTGLQMHALDIDKDGDIDLVCPGKSGLYLLENPRQ